MCVTLMPGIYVLLCGPKIRNKDSCILYLVASSENVPVFRVCGLDWFSSYKLFLHLIADIGKISYLFGNKTWFSPP